MTREEIITYLSSNGIDLEQGPDSQDFRLDDTIVLCGIRAYLSVDMTRQYFRTDPIVGVHLNSVTPDFLDTFISNYHEWKRKLEEDNRNMRAQKLREAIALHRKRSQ